MRNLKKYMVNHKFLLTKYDSEQSLVYMTPCIDFSLKTPGLNYPILFVLCVGLPVFESFIDLFCFIDLF